MPVPASAESTCALADAAQAGHAATGQAAGLAGLAHDRLQFDFLTGSDATDPAEAGIWGALKGSLLTMAVTLGSRSRSAC